MRPKAPITITITREETSIQVTMDPRPQSHGGEKRKTGVGVVKWTQEGKNNRRKDFSNETAHAGIDFSSTKSLRHMVCPSFSLSLLVLRVLDAPIVPLLPERGILRRKSAAAPVASCLLLVS